MRESTYVLLGEPQSYVTRNDRGEKEWSPKKAAHCIAVISIQGQHQGKLFSGPLDMYVTFFFPYPTHILKRERTGPFHATSPGLMYLYRFVEEITRGIVVDKFNSVVDLHLFKLYDEKPRTEIIVKERLQ